jgi:hypothetical protein
MGGYNRSMTIVVMYLKISLSWSTEVEYARLKVKLVQDKFYF